jgi:hypothetical protein
MVSKRGDQDDSGREGGESSESKKEVKSRRIIAEFCRTFTGYGKIKGAKFSRGREEALHTGSCRA